MEHGRTLTSLLLLTHFMLIGRYGYIFLHRTVCLLVMKKGVPGIYNKSFPLTRTHTCQVVEVIPQLENKPIIPNSIQHIINQSQIISTPGSGRQGFLIFVWRCGRTHYANQRGRRLTTRSAGTVWQNDCGAPRLGVRLHNNKHQY